MATNPVKPVPGARIKTPRVRALDRSRLHDIAAELGEQRLVLVVAPAGFGKTTLLAQFGDAWSGPVAWYRADSGDTSAAAVLSHLERTVRASVPLPPGGGEWASVEDACATLDAYAGPGVLLAIDDLHALHETPAEGALERLVDNLPPSVTMIAASRRSPGFNVSRLRVSSEVLELGAEDLRFRPWEVEALFRDFYGEPLLPEDLAALARRTDGWAAGLQLFHLATRGKPAGERRRILQALATRTRLVREYLTANVIDDLPRELRRFLIDTCVLGYLTPELCNELRDASDSSVWLAELDERQIFTHVLDEDGSYRYHEVLRSHLEALLVEELGDRAVRRLYRRAAELLEGAGAVPEALRAYCRAEEWESVSRLVVGSEERVIASHGGWLELLPASLVDQDPWLMLASARRYLADGDWGAALGRYSQAESAFGSGSGSETAQRERRSVAAWMQAVPVPPDNWAGVVRAATTRDPQAARHRAAGLDGATGLLATGLAALLAGAVRDARTCLEATTLRADASDAVVIGAEIGTAVAAMLSGQPAAETPLEAACDRSDRLGLSALAWIGRIAAQVDPRMAGAETGAAGVAGDWRVAIEGLMTSLGGLQAGEAPVESLAEATAAFRRLGAGSLEAWTRGAHAVAVARAGEPDARDTALAAESFARTMGVHGALALVYAALAAADPTRAAEYHALRRSVEDECGLDFSRLAPTDAGGRYAALDLSVTSGRLVGRSDELAALRRVVDTALAGTGRVVDIDGESGIGKTRLAEEVAVYAGERGATTLWGRGMEGAPAFWPWAQILRAHLFGRDVSDLSREVDGDFDALKLVVPELGELLSAAGRPAEPTARVSRFTVFRALMAVVERAASRTPLVLVLDDIHWADASSAALFHYAAKLVPDLPVVLISTRRGAAAAVGGSTDTLHLPLAGLTEPEVADLLAAVAARAAPAPLAHAVWRKTGGNPFFVHETAKLLLAEGRFDDASVVAADQVHIAAGVHDLVSRRTESLSAATMDVMRAASVVGRTFSLALLERVLAAEASAVLDAVSEGVAAGIVAESWADAGQYTFSHALIHESIYDQLEPATRVRLHRLVGNAIEASSSAFIESRLAELAHHFLRAAGDGGGEKAISYAIRAGEWAIVSGAYDEAVRQCEAALALLDDAGLSDERRADLMTTLAELRSRRGAPADQTAAIRLAEEAALLGRRLGRADLVARADAVCAPAGQPSELRAASRGVAAAEASGPSAGAPPLTVRCFGRFEIAIDGVTVDVSTVRPRHRSLLRLLACRAGRPVHREQLIESLWPAEADPKAGTRNLQVAISSLRRVLEPNADRGESTLVVREGDAYRLRVPDDADVDILELQRAIEDGRDAMSRGDGAAATRAFSRALAVYSGELLPEEGPSEWVVKAREHVRFEAAEAAQSLVEVELSRGNPAAAAAAGERGLQIDRFRDGLWRLVTSAYEQAGDAAAAARTRRAYAEVLDELGIPT